MFCTLPSHFKLLSATKCPNSNPFTSSFIKLSYISSLYQLNLFKSKRKIIYWLSGIIGEFEVGVRTVQKAKFIFEMSDDNDQWVAGQRLQVTVGAPANIALIKYWGKRDKNLILPLNDSISLGIDALQATTTVIVHRSGHDRVTINDKRVDIKNSRFLKCFDEMRRLLRKRNHAQQQNASKPPVSVAFEVISTTNFPVAAGLASSAAGFAAIAFAFQQLFKIEDMEMSKLARLGSGSACRGVFGGLVHWIAGSDPLGTDCCSEQRFLKTHWPELRAVICILNDVEKAIGSTAGMNRTIETSTLLNYRVEQVVPDRIHKVREAFGLKDFKSLAELIMRDSNQFHAVCMDTMPPLRYMNDRSWEIVDFVHEFNRIDVKAAYTFDAGPNACIFLEEDNLQNFLQKFTQKFSVSTNCKTSLKPYSRNTTYETPEDAVIKNIIISSVGGGPYVVTSPKVE